MEEDPRLHRTRFRWCNMGTKSPKTGLGYNCVVRVLSSMMVWNSANGSAFCRCTSHATQDDFLEDGPRHARFFETAWRAINGYVLALAFRNSRLLFGSDLSGASPRAHVRKPARVYSLHQSGGEDNGEEDQADGPSTEGQVSLIRGKGNVETFPTEQRNRQKARKEAGHVAKKKPQIVEYHHDGCGGDFGPLGDDYYNESFVDMPSLSDNSGGDTCDLISWDLGFNGSEFEPTAQSELNEGHSSMVFDDVESFARWDEGEGYFAVLPPQVQASNSSPPDDFAQLCGGAGDTAALLIRRGYRGGPNFDIVVGIDLMKRSSEEKFVQYIERLSLIHI